MSPRLIIKSLSRTLRSGGVEALEFSTGVNVLVGAQNTGKSTWLRMLDYLMLEDQAANSRFDDVIVVKYQAVSAVMTVGKRTLTLERAWNADGSRSTTTVDGERITLAELEALFFELLDMPRLRYPQGAVLTSERTWPSLSWRSLLRHIYRRQDFWSDLAPRQPESEQHACLLQFLGLAEHLYSAELAELVDKRRQIARAEARKEFFLELVEQIAPNLFDEEELEVGLTEGSIEAARERLDKAIDALIAQRSYELARVRSQEVGDAGDLKRLMDHRTAALARRDELHRRVLAIADRRADLAEYDDALRNELGRLGRASAAAEVLSPLRVTHCPACDQTVEAKTADPHHCFLCSQATPDVAASPEAAARRLKFERDQLEAELAEASDLISAAASEFDGLSRILREADAELRAVETALRPFQASVSQLVPESIALLDQQIGGLGTRKQGLDRLYEPLRMRDELTSEIDRLRGEASQLAARIAYKEESAGFEEASEWLSEGFNAYLTEINALDSETWTKSGQVAVRVGERKTVLSIGGRPAQPQLGGTLLIYFLFAYHYALLDLVRHPGTHSPGLAVLDLFPDIAKGPGMRDRLGVVLRPFARLAAREDVAPIQIIASARDFPASPNVRLLPLEQVWR